jgi:fucose permease
MLQVSGNPAIRDISPEGKFSRNLSFSQFIKSIGSMSGPLLPVLAIQYWNSDWKIVFPVYATALMITIIMTTSLDFEEKPSVAATFRSCFRILKIRPVLLMVMSIFLYVGAEVCLSSEIPIYMKAQYGVDISTVGLLGTGIFFIALTIGRFLGAVVLNWLTPRAFFYITTILSLIGIVSFFAGNQDLAYAGIFISGLGFANIFPLIFSITVDSMPERTNELSGLMVTAIVGGAVLPLLMGYIADITSPLVSFIVPLFAIILTIVLVSTARFNNVSQAG